MAKIKIKKNDIETDNVELPEEYVFKRVKTKKEKRDKINEQIDELEAQQGSEPTDQEIVDSSKEFFLHPYYQTGLILIDLEAQLIELAD